MNLLIIMLWIHADWLF